MTSGRKTLRQIEEGISDLRVQEKTLQGEMERDTKRHVALLEQRTSAFRDLAEVRARAAVSDGVIDRADRLEAQVANILSTRQMSIDSLKARDQEVHARRDEFNKTAEGLRREIDELEGRLDLVGREAMAQLEDDADYRKASGLVDDKQKTFERAETKTKRAEADRLEKGQAFESDPLFMYLWNRKYGSKHYEAGNIVRMGDAWVARLVRYNEARANYAILNEIPVRLRAHVDDLAAELEDLTQARDALIATRIEALAGSDLTQSLRDARERQDATNAALEKTETEITDLSLQLNRYAEGLDEMFQKAVTLSADFLARDRYSELLRLARSTSEPTDDSIVERIGALEREAETLEKNLKGRRKKLDRLAKRRHELLEAAGNFRRNRYDDETSFFEPDDLAEDLLKLLLQGGLTAAEYWLRSQGQHGWRGRSADPFRRSGGWPPFGGGGGRRSGRSRSRRRGGRFSTGGGF
ncbi:MAG: hypothetical protein AAFV45_07450 [Pseudomonadota bacterium]